MLRDSLAGLIEPMFRSAGAGIRVSGAINRVIDAFTRLGV